MFWQKTSVLVVITAFSLPWVFLLWRVFRGRSVLARFFLGGSCGLAASIIACYLFTLLGFFEYCSLWMLFPWALLITRTVYDFGDFSRLVPDRIPYRCLDPWLLLFPLIAIIFAIPVLMSEYPPGIDPTFHCLVARKIVLSGHLAADMLPFEDIDLNYTQGIHSFIAAVSTISGQPPHMVFQLLHLPFMLLYVAGIYFVARQILKDRIAALLAMAAFALMTDGGRFFIAYTWGGLPTEIAGTFALAFLLLMMKLRSPPEYAAAIVLCGAMVVSHHLTALIYFLAVMFFIVSDLLFRRSRLACVIPRRFFIAGCGTLAAYCWFIVPYAMKLSNVGGTSVFRFAEEPMITPWQAVHNFSYLLAVAGIVGICYGLKRFHDRPRFRFLLGWFAGILLFYVLLDYVYRFGALLIFGEAFSAFIPSRFLFFLTCPLAIFAGLGMRVLMNRLTTFLPRKTSNVVPFFFVAGLVVRGFCASLTVAGDTVVRPAVIEVADLIRSTTPPNAFIFDRLSLDLNERCWLSYLTWRQMLLSPVPSTENREKVYLEKLAYLDANLGYPEKIREWMRRRGLEGYLVFESADGTYEIVKLYRALAAGLSDSTQLLEGAQKPAEKRGF